ncbi:MAG: ATP-binding protein [Pseudanabaena sp.]|jgi:signal transduction histidine kinase/CheY-like chemotaxis protein|nr:response regulator [Pseudanabaena sp. M051S1SP1A06QC]
MDSLILNQSLEIYGQSLVATCRLTTKTSEALNLLKKGWSSVVVLDENDQPQGLLSARCLLNWQAEPDSCTFVAPAISLEDIDLEPLPAISSTMTVIDFLQRIFQYRHSADTWALIGSDGKFAGLLEVSILLRSIIKTEQTDQSSIASLLLPLIYQLPLPVRVSDQNGMIVGMNSSWRNSLYDLSPRSGRQIQVIVGDAFGDFVAPEDAHQLLQTHIPETHQFCTTDGQSFTWQVMNVPLQGSLQGLELSIAYDISAQKNLAQELSGLSRLKDEFLTCINHELKTPLTSVIGIASLLSNNTFGELNDRQSRYVKMIHQSGRQLVSIIDNIFDLAKAEAGQLELYAETVSVKDVCLKSIQQVRKLVQQDSAISRNYNFEEGWELDINLDIDPTIQTISADETRLQQMLVNLLSNAFKFSVLPSGLVGDLPHSSPKIGITVRRWEGWLAITVWDQGIGIPEEKQCLVFQKFQQMENVLTRRFEGTGSSLLLTRHLARLHGGDITFVSQVDVGSQFTILLPPEPTNSDQQAVSNNGVRSRLVLIVETSSEVLDWLRTTLADLEYQVVIARSGTEALEKARRLQPCLILLSPDLPMLSGWDVLALLKGDPSTHHIRMVMMKRADEPRINVHQADGILLKPIKAAELHVFLPHSLTITKPLKFLYLNQNLDDTVINLLQDLGHCLLGADDLPQCEVLSKIWQPELFLLDGDRQTLVTYLETISQLEMFVNLPILIISRASVVEIDWLKSRFAELSLHECIGLNLEELETNRSETLLVLHQSIAKAIYYRNSYLQTNTVNTGRI